eukprot:7036788-Pyramimonas_sp.AAC.2
MCRLCPVFRRRAPPHPFTHNNRALSPEVIHALHVPETNRRPRAAHTGVQDARPSDFHTYPLRARSLRRQPYALA